MSLSYSLKCSLLSASLLGLTVAAPAQSIAPDVSRAAVPPHLLLKMGLRLTHLSYSPGSQTWRLVVPASASAEYRLAPRFSIYGSAEADLQASHLAMRRRRVATSSLPSAGLAMGLRCYYDQSKRTGAEHAGGPYGNYLALEGGVVREEIAGTYLTQFHRRMPTSLTPSVYALWGTQHQFRRFALYDVNAGFGIKMPPYYNFEHIGPAHYDVAVQVNIRIYYGFGF